MESAPTYYLLLIPSTIATANPPSINLFSFTSALKLPLCASVNWSQAVLRVRFEDGVGEEQLEMEEANEGEKE